jgi:hypothetical protein
MPHVHIPHFHMPKIRALPGDHRLSTGNIWLWALVGLAFLGALYVAFNSSSYYADLLAAGPVYPTPW